MAVLVHASLSALGWVCGGPVTVVQALQEVLTPAGTLVMPAHSGDNSDPARWENPPVPRAWIPLIREEMPAYDPRLTPTRGMGRIAELFRVWPGVERSAHPTLSFAAWGQQAHVILEDHGLEYGLGEGSPLARLYVLDGHVLLLGTGFDRNTSFHLAEYRAPGAQHTMEAAAILEDGRRVWREYRDIVLDAGPFQALGRDFEATGAVRRGQVGVAEARLFRQRAAVDHAVGWLEQRQGRR
jgi:aminoglycoside 3-N-acetyltransferase